MKTTIVREYETDDDGSRRLVSETITTEDEQAPFRYVCTCGPWHSVIPPPPCPVHGPYWYQQPAWTWPTLIVSHTNTAALT